jgi:hypothetical protein
VGASQDRPEERPGDRVPDDDREQEQLVEETSEDSFPASDAPAYWGRETADDAPSSGDGGSG